MSPISPSRLALLFSELERDGPVPHLGTPLTHPAISQLPTSPSCLPTPRETPERPSIMPDSGVEARNTDLSPFTEGPGSFLPIALPGPCVNRDTQSSPFASNS